MSSTTADEAALRAAIAHGNIPILLMVLVQLTGDLRWLDEPYTPSRTVGMDDNDDGGLTPELQSEVREAAVDAIVQWTRDGEIGLEVPDENLLLRLLSVCMGEPVEGLSGARIAAALSTVLRPEANAVEAVDVPDGFQVAIVGAGFSGLCMAARLTQAGVPYVIIEKQSDVGGVWWSNTYPGAGVDTPSYLYSLSFVPYEWRHYYAGRAEVHDYLRHIADTFDIAPHVRLQTEVLRAQFNTDEQLWTLDVRERDGVVEQIRANLLVSGVGIFNPPVIPRIDGLESFDGPAFHTAEWPGGVDLAGKRVAVVGNGASAMQTVPVIAPIVDSLVVFQRSPHWIAPFAKFRQEVPDATAVLLREVPLYRAWFRERLGWIFGDRNFSSLHKDRSWNTSGGLTLNAQNAAHRRFYERYIRTKLADRPDLIEKCTPDFPPYAKRMLLDNGWYDSLLRDNVTLESSAITKIVPSGIVTESGAEYDVDVIVFATGFGVTEFVSTFDVIGKDGRTLREEWNGDDARAYLGLTVPGFPNLFTMYGPNINGGGGSVLGHLEAQTHYVIELLRAMTAEHLDSVDVRREKYDAYAEHVAKLHDDLIYTHDGVNTYYRNSRGRVVVQNPFSNTQYWQLTRSPDLADYFPARAAVRVGCASDSTAVS
jgi:4-hydroxyacetophenone monooxygenase